jgi:hypothetical protein
MEGLPYLPLEFFRFVFAELGHFQAPFTFSGARSTLDGHLTRREMGGTLAALVPLVL